jgi:septal ring factor EnvC (AmiA/AmiB activator)
MQAALSVAGVPFLGIQSNTPAAGSARSRRRLVAARSRRASPCSAARVEYESRMVARLVVVALTALVLAAPAAGAVDASGEQLEAVRTRIRDLEAQLERLEAETSAVAREQEVLAAELGLAEARVRENELVLDQSRAEAEQLRAETAALAEELVASRALVAKHLEMMALLGGPGPLQLLFDAALGGDLEEAVSTVSMLTAGQVRLLEEYDQLTARHAERLAELSVILERAQEESRALDLRRGELETVRARVDARLRRLEQSQRATGDRLAELRQREQALGRLMQVLATRERLTGKDGVRRYRGALPASRGGGAGLRPSFPIATYTVCNGLRFNARSGAPVLAVFQGTVAYAQHLKGYGNMVVVDHGNEVYSLAAGLAAIHVRVDQRVEMGTRVGLAAPPEDDVCGSSRDARDPALAPAGGDR